jgi:Putative 8-oxoguanine DNA glycosylase OGG-like protein
MTTADEIRVSLEARIEELETELRKLKAARAALTAAAGEGNRDHATRRRTRRGRPAALSGGADADEIPGAVLRAFQRWDARGRPPQAAAVWQRERWIAAIPDQARLLEALPDRLDRSTVRQLALEKPWTPRGMFEAMIIVYTWGWSTTPVGVSRSDSALRAGEERLGSALVAARNAMRTGGPRNGYAALRGPNRVAGLGPSFGSKFLYFVSPEDQRALILDQLVAKWLGREASLSLNATWWSIRTFDAYMSTMTRWSARLRIPGHQLEEILFTEEATRRGLATWAVR